MRKVGIPFNPGVAVDPDLTGLAATFTAEYRLEGSTAAFTAITGLFTEEYAGFYSIPLTISTPGSYLIKFTSTDTRIGILEGYVQVANTSLDDIQTAIDTMQLDMSSVKTQVDLLDEAALNGVSAQVSNLATTVSTINTLLNDSTDTYFELDADETVLMTVGTPVRGTTSLAEGTITSSVWDATLLVNKVVVTGTVGTFAVGETISTLDVLGGVVVATTIGLITVTSLNVVNSVYEFVNQINATLLSGGSSLDILRTFSLDVQHMIKGDALLEDGTANPTAAKGVTQIFDELKLNHTDLTALKTLAEDATVGFTAIKNAVDAGVISIEAKIAGLNDLTDPNSLASKLVAVQATVDNNGAILGDVTFGNSAIKTAIDALATSTNSDTTTILSILNDATNGLAAIKTAIIDKLVIMDGKLDTIISTQTATVATRVIL